MAEPEDEWPESTDEWKVTVIYKEAEVRCLQLLLHQYLDQTRTFATLACPNDLRALEDASSALTGTAILQKKRP